MVYRIKSFFRTIYKFIYYGYYGAKTVAYDASSMDILILAHMKRVQKFMKSDKTHLMWNSKEYQNKGLMRKLDEFVELCKRKQNEFPCYHNMDKVIEKHGKNDCWLFGLEKRTKEYNRDMKIALKKDRMIRKQQSDRYYELYEKYLPGFWD